VNGVFDVRGLKLKKFVSAKRQRPNASTTIHLLSPIDSSSGELKAFDAHHLHPIHISRIIPKMGFLSHYNAL
jgi:hypothetical protein